MSTSILNWKCQPKLRCPVGSPFELTKSHDLYKLILKHRSPLKTNQSMRKGRPEK